MKKIIILGVLVMLMLFTGCYSKYVCPDGSTVNDPSKCPTVEELKETAEEMEESLEKLKESVEEIDEIPDGEKFVTVPEKRVEPEFQDFVDDVNTYDNYEFKYTGPESAYNMEVSVKGDRLKYYFKDYTIKHDIAEFYDTVVLDMENKAAYQYCGNKVKCSDSTMGFYRVVDYADKKIPTLQEVMNSITEAEIIGDEMVMQKSSKKVEYTDDEGITGIMWVDKFFGVPLRKEYTIGDKEKVEIFDAFSKGGVTDGMVSVPGSLEEK